jgi:hypothetical protein
MTMFAFDRRVTHLSSHATIAGYPLLFYCVDITVITDK